MIRKAGQRFVDLDEQKQSFVFNLTKEISKRELDKLSEFKKKFLNIKLEKFTGYDGPIDFFTFKTNFEKMFDSFTPSHLLPDLFKNNYLAGPVLAMVKSTESIIEIWQRLKEAFGNPRLMLTRKIQVIESMEIHRKDVKKLSVSLSRIISIMKKVSTLAEKHSIEEYLYYGDIITSLVKDDQIVSSQVSVTTY